MYNENLEKEKLKEQQEHRKKVYSDKASRLLKYSIIVFAISFLTYILGFVFDFGIIFEGIAFVLVLISLYLITHNALLNSKKTLIFSLFCIAWLIVYDIFDIISTITTYKYFSLDLIDYTLLINVFLIYKSYISVCKALNDTEYKESTDWFYDAK